MEDGSATTGRAGVDRSPCALMRFIYREEKKEKNMKQELNKGLQINVHTCGRDNKSSTSSSILV